ncbi:hypothetical protein ACLB2K_075630 [Fragaria x ananassa]
MGYPPPYRAKKSAAHILESSPTRFGESSKKDPDVELQALVNDNIELSPGIKELIGFTLDGMRRGCPPALASSGMSGAYVMSKYTDDGEREDISVFKPMDEEIGAVNNPRKGGGGSAVKGVVVGEGAVREVASYLLDYPQSGYRRSYTDEIGFSGVPPTIMVECLHEKFNGEEKRKRGSLQKFMVSKGDCEGYGNNKFSELSEHEVHKISVLDIRLANADRHLGNLLLSTEEDQLIPIDHGCCIPENFERCRFDWIGWSQCKKAYSQETLNYIRKINPDEDIKYLQAHGLILSDESQQTLRISSMILKQGAQAGKTPHQIGSMFHKDDSDDKEYESVVQKLVREAREATSASFFKHLSYLVDQHFGMGEGICHCGHQYELILQKEIDMRIQAEDTSNMLRNLLKETDHQSKAKDLKIADLNMELKHEREIKRQAEVQIRAKDLEIAMLTQERVKKIKRDWWLWGTVATALTIGAACLAYSNPSESTYQVDD